MGRVEVGDVEDGDDCDDGDDSDNGDDGDVGNCDGGVGNDDSYPNLI